ncbi:hypothetical protein ANN_17759 [Periplaneta americana]|uniref:Uncharacterized protein n=1 Tax=Periplaneta americana TaxID=6978 RepID=A0ABQ8SUV1_PERAM|nr:hypothetical protein ANN_17759 [Periplaneta americana]
MSSMIAILWQRCTLKQMMFPLCKLLQLSLSMRKCQNQICLIPEKGAILSGSQDSLESLPADAATLTPKLQVSLAEISPISNNISLGRSANKAQKMIVIMSSPYKQRLGEVKSKQLKGDVLKILHRRSRLKPNSRFLQMVQRDVILTRSHGIVASVAMT